MAASWTAGELVLVEVAGERVEGRVWAVEAASSLLVLRAPLNPPCPDPDPTTEVPSQRQQAEFRLIAYKGATKLPVPGPVQERLRALPVLALPPPDAAQVARREHEALLKAQAQAQKLGQGVTREAQELFNAIELLYPQTRWQGSAIRVLNAVEVAPPYKEATLVGGPTDLLRLVQNIVDAQRRRRDKEKQ